jgi:hypothetical protein
MRRLVAVVSLALFIKFVEGGMSSEGKCLDGIVSTVGEFFWGSSDDKEMKFGSFLSKWWSLGI